MTDAEARAIFEKVIAETVVVFETDEVFELDRFDFRGDQFSIDWGASWFFKKLTGMNLNPTFAMWDEFNIVDTIVTDENGVEYQLHFKYSDEDGEPLKVWDVVLTLE